MKNIIFSLQGVLLSLLVSISCFIFFNGAWKIIPILAEIGFTILMMKHNSECFDALMETKNISSYPLWRYSSVDAIAKKNALLARSSSYKFHPEGSGERQTEFTRNLQKIEEHILWMQTLFGRPDEDPEEFGQYSYRNQISPFLVDLRSGVVELKELQEKLLP